MEICMYSEKIDIETRNRIRVALAALAYEEFDNSIMSDAEFDQLARKIDLSVETRRPDLDSWFKANFQPWTGAWVHNHPEKDKLEKILRDIFFV